MSSPVPLATYTKSDLQKKVVEMWGQSSPSALASSSFTAAERYYLFEGLVLERIIAVLDDRIPCPTVKLLSASDITPASKEGIKSEVWTVDVCSVSLLLTLELNEEERSRIAKNPVVTDPVL